MRWNIGYHRPSASSAFEGDPIGLWHALPAATQLSLLCRPPYTRPGFLPDRGAFTTPNEPFRFCVHDARAYARPDDILLACTLRRAECPFESAVCKSANIGKKNRKKLNKKHIKMLPTTSPNRYFNRIKLRLLLTTLLFMAIINHSLSNFAHVQFLLFLNLIILLLK